MCTCPRSIKLIYANIICSSIGQVSSNSHLSDMAKIAFRTIGRPFRLPLPVIAWHSDIEMVTSSFGYGGLPLNYDPQIYISTTKTRHISRNMWFHLPSSKYILPRQGSSIWAHGFVCFGHHILRSRPHAWLVNIDSGNWLMARSHYLNQCWPSSVMPYGIISRPQWVNSLTPGRSE